MSAVRKAEAKECKLLKVADGGRLTEKQQQTLHPMTHHPLHSPCPEVHSA
ncbi:hypothetical protein DFAR_1150012 [Desulfarculales bacterium]